MKLKVIFTLLATLFIKIIWACPVCEERQPKIMQGITHGAGPQSDWDWVIIAIISAITILTLVYSLKFLIKPGEKNNDHIKKSILSN